MDFSQRAALELMSLFTWFRSQVVYHVVLYSSAVMRAKVLG